MNREYVFRGKCVGDIGSWAYGYYHYDSSVGLHYIATQDKLVRKEVIPKSVGQWTGLKDKAGNDIYEQDVVEVEYGRGLVVFNAGCFMIQWVDDPEAYMEPLGFYYKSGRKREDLQVLGNALQHPHLIQKQ